MKILLVVAALLIALTFPAQAACGSDPTCSRTLSNYERVLLPLLPWVVTDGAGHARWQTDLWVANDSTVARDAFPFARNDCTTSIYCRGMLRDYPAFAPGVVDHGVYDDSLTRVEIAIGRTAGGFIYVERSALDHLSFSLHVRDTERGSRAFGTDIPVVRESRFFTVARSILGVPVNGDSRIALRIYSVSSGAIRLRVQEMTGRWVVEPQYHFVPPALLAEEQIELRYDAASDVCPLLSGCPSVPYKPATFEISDLVQQLPALGSAFGSNDGVRIEIEPLTPGLAYWPMVSVTSNLTNEVALFLVR